MASTSGFLNLFLYAVYSSTVLSMLDYEGIGLKSGNELLSEWPDKNGRLKTLQYVWLLRWHEWIFINKYLYEDKYLLVATGIF